MKINEIFKHGKTVFSFEVFPPKKDAPIDTIYTTLSELKDLNPDFISVTYGAGGREAGNSKTCENASIIKDKYNITPVAHLTCVNSTKEEVLRELENLKNHGIENILALRGDIIPDIPRKNDFLHASELVSFIKENGNFHISGACYPEVHQDAANMIEDITNLKKKVDAGASYLVTQIFFDNSYYYRLVKEARKRGITVPILAGVMPITNAKSLLHTAKMCGCSIPYQLSTMIESHYHSPAAMKEIGINYATHQIIDLITNGVDGIHIYTMNKPEIAKAIFDSIPTVLKELNHE